jgi:hypothetical protein
MDIILREHIDNLGRRGEIVKVADGYARNFLLPRKLALIATEGNKKQVERERVSSGARARKKVAEAVAARLANIEIVIAQSGRDRSSMRLGHVRRSPKPCWRKASISSGASFSCPIRSRGSATWTCPSS